MPGENQDKLMSGNQPEVQYAAFLAIDWADQKHVWSLQEANSSARERGEVDHMPEAVETWVAQLSQRFAGRPIAVAVEQSRGALVFLLSKYAQLHIFPVPPAMPALKDRAVVQTKVAVVKVSVQLIQVLHEGIEGLNRQIQEAAEAHPDFFIFDSLPGAGAVMAPRLLAAFGSQRERYQNAVEMQTFSGIAPVTESSGKSSWVHFRFACSKFLRQSFHEWAALSITQSQWARAYYELQVRRGKKHHAAVRALAFKWIRIIYRCWKERVAYDENVYLAALAKHNSPLVAATKAAL